MTAELFDYEPARVHIVKDDTKGPVQSQRKFCGAVSKTYLAGTSPELILPRAAGRRCSTIMCIGKTDGSVGNVILADCEADAQAAVTYAGTISQTLAGAAMQPGMFIRVTHNDEVWLARLGTAGTAPLVSVITENEAY